MNPKIRRMTRARMLLTIAAALCSLTFAALALVYWLAADDRAELEERCRTLRHPFCDTR